VTEVHIEGQEGEEGVPVDDWPLSPQLAELEAIDPKQVVNSENLGALRFTDADTQFREIVSTLRDLKLEDWNQLPTDLTQEIAGNLNDLLTTVREMIALSPASDPANYQGQQVQLQARFTGHYTFFRNRVRPVCLTARLAHVLRTRSDLWGGDLSPERIGQLQREIEQLEETASELQALAPLVEAQREIVGESGAAKLSHDFEERAKAHATSFFRWSLALVAVVVVGGIGSVLFVYESRPPNNGTNAEIVTHVLLDILVLGLIVFLVRFTALQTRAHRHMQFVATNKANALSTFNRIVAGQQDQDVRATVASALAQAVFKSDDGIFSDASSDTVTIIERMGAVVGSRVPGV
jgi:hypothetical protein